MKSTIQTNLGEEAMGKFNNQIQIGSMEKGTINPEVLVNRSSFFGITLLITGKPQDLDAVQLPPYLS